MNTESTAETPSNEQLDMEEINHFLVRQIELFESNTAIQKRLIAEVRELFPSMYSELTRINNTIDGVDTLLTGLRDKLNDSITAGVNDLKELNHEQQIAIQNHNKSMQDSIDALNVMMRGLMDGFVDRLKNAVEDTDANALIQEITQNNRKLTQSLADFSLVIDKSVDEFSKLSAESALELQSMLKGRILKFEESYKKVEGNFMKKAQGILKLFGIYLAMGVTATMIVAAGVGFLISYDVTERNIVSSNEKVMNGYLSDYKSLAGNGIRTHVFSTKDGQLYLQIRGIDSARSPQRLSGGVYVVPISK